MECKGGIRLYGRNQVWMVTGVLFSEFLRKLSAEELMLLNCGVGEDSWESFGLQGDQTGPSWRKSVLNIHWKDCCWSWNSNILATWCEEQTDWKRPWCWERLKEAGEEADNRGRDGWMGSLNQLWDGGRQGSLVCAVHGVAKIQTRPSNWTTTRESCYHHHQLILEHFLQPSKKPCTHY